VGTTLREALVHIGQLTRGGLGKPLGRGEGERLWVPNFFKTPLGEFIRVYASLSESPPNFDSPIAARGLEFKLKLGLPRTAARPEGLAVRWHRRKKINRPQADRKPRQRCRGKRSNPTFPDHLQALKLAQD